MRYFGVSGCVGHQRQSLPTVVLKDRTDDSHDTPLVCLHSDDDDDLDSCLSYVIYVEYGP